MDLRKQMTIKDVARSVSVSDTIVRGIDKKYLKRNFCKPRLRDLKIIAIDEIDVERKNEFFTIVVHMETGAIVFVGDGTGEKALKPFWKRLRSSRAKVETVATETVRVQFAAVMKNLPKAKHVSDRLPRLEVVSKPGQAPGQCKISVELQNRKGGCPGFVSAS